MTFLQTLILGIVEGITEFLPISSTGHLILTSRILGIVQSEFVKSFEIIVQLGAIASVVVLYWKSFFVLENLKKLAIAFLPTGIIGLSLYKTIKMYLIGNDQIVLWSLFIGGIVLIIFEYFHKEHADGIMKVGDVSYGHAFIIGLFQSLSIVPGVSRSAASIVGGLVLGLRRRTVVEFSFLLAVPTMVAASGLDLIKNASAFTGDQFGVLGFGFIIAFVVALITIKIFLRYIQRHSFVLFGVYRIVIAIILWSFVIF